MNEITRFDMDMDGSMEPSEHGQWVRYQDAQRTAVEGEDTRRAWVGLTDEQVEAIAEEFGVGGWICDFARAIEAELKEKNT